ncbi:ATP synthase F0 subunit C [bacterium]|nr:ATP synthase F0 subunit C [bacterium]
MDLTALAHLGAGIAIGFGAIGAGIGVGIATKGFLEAVARQPEIKNTAVTFFFVGAAMSEACAIYAFIVSLVLLFK